jgi:hypothetical protein
MADHSNSECWGDLAKKVSEKHLRGRDDQTLLVAIDRISSSQSGFVRNRKVCGTAIKFLDHAIDAAVTVRSVSSSTSDRTREGESQSGPFRLARTSDCDAAHSDMNTARISSAWTLGEFSALRLQAGAPYEARKQTWRICSHFMPCSLHCDSRLFRHPPPKNAALKQRRCFPAEFRCWATAQMWMRVRTACTGESSVTLLVNEDEDLF